MEKNIKKNRPTLSRRLSSYQFDFDQSKLSCLHSDIPIYENSTDIITIHVTYELWLILKQGSTSLNIIKYSCHCTDVIVVTSCNVVKKKKYFHETNYTESQNIVNNKSMNSSMIWFHNKYNCPWMWRRIQHITKLRAVS